MILRVSLGCHSDPVGNHSSSPSFWFWWFYVSIPWLCWSILWVHNFDISSSVITCLRLLVLDLSHLISSLLRLWFQLLQAALSWKWHVTSCALSCLPRSMRYWGRVCSCWISQIGLKQIALPVHRDRISHVPARSFLVSQRSTSLVLKRHWWEDTVLMCLLIGLWGQGNLYFGQGERMAPAVSHDSSIFWTFWSWRWHSWYSWCCFQCWCPSIWQLANFLCLAQHKRLSPTEFMEVASIVRNLSNGGLMPNSLCKLAQVVQMMIPIYS